MIVVRHGKLYLPADFDRRRSIDIMSLKLSDRRLLKLASLAKSLHCKL